MIRQEAQQREGARTRTGATGANARRGAAFQFGQHFGAVRMLYANPGFRFRRAQIKRAAFHCCVGGARGSVAGRRRRYGGLWLCLRLSH